MNVHAILDIPLNLREFNQRQRSTRYSGSSGKSKSDGVRRPANKNFYGNKKLNSRGSVPVSSNKSESQRTLQNMRLARPVKYNVYSSKADA